MKNMFIYVLLYNYWDFNERIQNESQVRRVRIEKNATYLIIYW